MVPYSNTNYPFFRVFNRKNNYLRVFSQKIMILSFKLQKLQNLDAKMANFSQCGPRGWKTNTLTIWQLAPTLMCIRMRALFFCIYILPVCCVCQTFVLVHCYCFVTHLLGCYILNFLTIIIISPFLYLNVIFSFLSSQNSGSKRPIFTYLGLLKT
jgi:hypothetical protein